MKKIATTKKGLVGSANTVITAAGKLVAIIITILVLAVGPAAQAAVPGPEESGSQLDALGQLKAFWKQIPKANGAVQPTPQQWDDIIVLIMPNWQDYARKGKLKPSAQAIEIRKAKPAGRVLYIKLQKGTERLTADADSPALGISKEQFEAACAERGIKIRKGPRQR